MSDLLPSLDQAQLARVHGQTERVLQQAKQAESPDAARNGAKPGMDAAKIEEVANGFESIFLQMLVKELRNTVQKSEFLEGESSALNMYEDMLDENLVQQLGSTNSLGIGKMVKSQLEEMQKNVYDPDSDFVKRNMAEQAAKAEEVKKVNSKQ